MQATQNHINPNVLVRALVAKASNKPLTKKQQKTVDCVLRAVRYVAAHPNDSAKYAG
jgi:hypothetical protein